MGILSGLDKIVTQMNWDATRRDLPSWYVRLVEDALSLEEADALTPKRLAKLANGDVDTLRQISKSAPLPGSTKQIASIRKAAKKAVVQLLTQD